MACDLSLGRLEPCKDNIGGLRAVYFVNYGDFDGITFDATDTDAIDELFDSGSTPSVYKYDLKGISNFEQTIVSSRDNGTTVFQQIVTLVIKGLDAATLKEVKLMSYGRPNIIIEDNNGKSWVAGLDRGCDVTGGTISNGANLEDFVGYNITFEGKESMPANYIVGSIAGDPFAGMDTQPTIVEGV